MMPCAVLNRMRLHRLLFLGQERQNCQRDGAHTEYQQKLGRDRVAGEVHHGVIPVQNGEGEKTQGENDDQIGEYRSDFHAEASSVGSQMQMQSEMVLDGL